ATGAAAVTSVPGINQGLAGPQGGFATVTQSATNNGTVTNAPAVPGVIVNGVVAQGASASVGASGAISAFSVTGVAAPGGRPVQWNPPGAGLITQTSTNTANVTNIDAQ